MRRRASHVLDTGRGCTLTDERDDRFEGLSIRQAKSGFLFFFQVFLSFHIFRSYTFILLMISTFSLLYLLPPDIGFYPNHVTQFSMLQLRFFNILGQQNFMCFQAIAVIYKWYTTCRLFCCFNAFVTKTNQVFLLRLSTFYFILHHPSVSV